MRYEDLEIQEYTIDVPEESWEAEDGEVFIVPAHKLMVLETEVAGLLYGMHFTEPPAVHRLYPELLDAQQEIRHAAFSRYLYERGVIDEAF